MMSTGLDDIEKVLAHRNRRTKAKASEKVWLIRQSHHFQY